MLFGNRVIHRHAGLGHEGCIAYTLSIGAIISQTIIRQPRRQRFHIVFPHKTGLRGMVLGPQSCSDIVPLGILHTILVLSNHAVLCRRLRISDDLRAAVIIRIIPQVCLPIGSTRHQQVRVAIDIWEL